ncbi:CAP domain-containing protein [Desertibaculum subflavum]|uniref:CAP domain-containing protein n=1 Tax=Desertibaculum subflavum TaxID=2268458 RepID=UPI0013C4A5AB
MSAAASTADLESLRRHALDLVNRARHDEGLGPLMLRPAANAAAQAHADDMLARGYYSHTAPSGATVIDRYQQAGGSTSHLAAENIARCATCQPPSIGASVEALHEGWMQSPLHRDNILRRGVTAFGFGIAASAERGLYAVQVFAGPGQPHDLQPGEAATPLDPETQWRTALAQVNRLRREAGRPPLESSQTLVVAAQALLPSESEAFSLTGRDLYAALPEGERRSWRSLAVLGAACGGCGEAPAAADIRDFAQRWRNDEGYRVTLLAAGATHFGFAMAANGEGRKLGVAVIGTRR